MPSQDAFHPTMDYFTGTTLGLAYLLNAVLMMLLCNPTGAHIKQGQDCFKDFEEQKFLRLGASLYRCWPKGKVVFRCYPGSAIPSWYDRGDTDPCICIQVYSKAKGKRAHICPVGPSKARSPKKNTFDLGSNDLEQVNNKVNPHAGTLSLSTAKPTTCYMAFDSVVGYSREDNETSFSLGLDHGSAIFGHFIAKDLRHCQDQCLSLDHCRALQFTLLNPLLPQGFCKGFTDFGDKDDFSPKRGATYFVRKGCYDGSPYNQLVPSTTAAVSLAFGPLFQFSQQPGGELVNDLNGGEEQCRRYCHSNKECVAIDYNMAENECWWHRSTSCSAHVPATDRCCNHYKKHIQFCPYS